MFGCLLWHDWKKEKDIAVENGNKRFWRCTKCGEPKITIRYKK